MYGLYGFLKKKLYGLYGLFFENCTDCTDFIWKCTDFCTDGFKKVLATLYLFAYISVCLHLCLFTYLFFHICVCLHICLFTYLLFTYLLVYIFAVFTYLFVYICECLHICLFIYLLFTYFLVCIFVCSHICLFTYLFVYKFVVYIFVCLDIRPAFNLLVGWSAAVQRGISRSFLKNFRKIIFSYIITNIYLDG